MFQLKPETSNPSPSQSTKVENSANGDSAETETEMAAPTPEEDEDLSRAEEKPEEERAEVEPDDRNLTASEQEQLGKTLGAEWKKLGQKLGFTSDEVCANSYFFFPISGSFPRISMHSS